MEPQQGVLMEIPEQSVLSEPARAGQQRSAPPRAEPRLKPIVREQTTLAMIYVEELIGPDHKARAIWELAGRLDLSRFKEPIGSREGSAGRPGWDPQLLVSVWVYAYSEGISSAREIERLLEWEPGFQWLSGLQGINHHTLSDFRVDHQEALEELFTELLGLLASQGLLSLERVMHDGTKIRAQAGVDSFRREKKLGEHLEEARKVVQQMGDPKGEAPQRSRTEAARERAARERGKRLEAAVEALAALQAEKKKEEEKGQVRVSESEPEARMMKHGDHAIAPSYNVQISTDAKEKIIVGVHLSQCSSDEPSLVTAVQEVEQNLGKQPTQVVVDGGYISRENIVAMAEGKIDLIGPLPDPEKRTAAAMKAAGIDVAFAPQKFVWETATNTLRCPGEQVLEYVRQSQKRGNVYWQYQANGKDCSSCRFQAQCCPNHPARGRTVSVLQLEQAEVAAFRDKMKQSEVRQIYRQRGEVAEFPNAWIKEKLGLRKFRVRGFAKAGLEAVWACLTYNVMQWMRLLWTKRLEAIQATT